MRTTNISTLPPFTLSNHPKCQMDLLLLTRNFTYQKNCWRPEEPAIQICFVGWLHMWPAFVLTSSKVFGRSISQNLITRVATLLLLESYTAKHSVKAAVHRHRSISPVLPNLFVSKPLVITSSKVLELVGKHNLWYFG